MMTENEIKITLSDIRFYYANIRSFQNASKYVGENKIVKTAEKYSKAIEVAPPKLYELYIHKHTSYNQCCVLNVVPFKFFRSKLDWKIMEI